MSPRGERLVYITSELRNIRENRIVLTGSTRVAEIRMLDTLTEAVAMLAKDADKPRSAASTVRRWAINGSARL